MGFDMAKLRFVVDSVGLRRGGKDLDAFAKQAKVVDKAAKGAALAVRSLGLAAAGIGVGAAFTASIRKAKEFDSALTEVSTLIKGTPKEMELLRKEARRLSDTYGGDLTLNTKAFYQAISAGAKTVADASKMVRNWGGGGLEGDMMTLLHRVVFYGDHLQSAQHLADLMNMKVVEEG